MILSINDFVGKYQLSTGMYDQAKLQDYINRYEPRYLKELLGVSLYNDFMADLLNNAPQSPNFQVIFNPLSEDMGYNFYYFNGIYEGVNQIDSEGIKEMLKGFVYFEYAKDLVNTMTPFGNVKQVSENSEVANTLFSMMYTRYNEAIRSYNSIRSFIKYISNPPLGQIVDFTIWNGGIGYITANNLTCVNGSGQSALVNIVANSNGGINLFTITAVGTGYTDGIYTITTGSGTNCDVNVVTNNLGEVASVSIENAGENYLVGDVITIPGGNNDAFFTVDNVTNASIIEVTIVDGGKNYEIGDYVNIEQGANLTASIQVNYIGIGDYRKFRGVPKSTAYWL
jgi:hypothetical protein